MRGNEAHDADPGRRTLPSAEFLRRLRFRLGDEGKRMLGEDFVSSTDASVCCKFDCNTTVQYCTVLLPS